ncbi:cupin domain-containing protein [Streptomyces anulatus]|uniref:Peptide synthetase n=3 Tax=Streptomyces TaxID=1883 RepID=A0A6G3SQE3_STRAQ|nr:peptide synthetase [Streptomyces anulatus]NDZ62475.1 peptide synthetase [Streptomyces anulatus]NEB85119.1 peptide synthetase [Streptomyces anulatus]
MSPVSRIKSAPDDPNGIVRRYAANAPFRSATAEELVNEDNPFRRPVRPHDLGFLDYGTPLTADRALRLSALLGHRMLRTVHDADLLFVPAGGDGHPSSDDAEAFRSLDNRVLALQAGQVLENHLFHWLDGERTPLEGGAEAVTRHVQDVLEERRARPGRALDVARSSRHRADAATFTLTQLTAARPAVQSAVGRGLLGDYGTAHPALRGLLLDDLRDRADREAHYRALLTGAGLSAEPYAYWQFLLGSSLGGANHLHSVSRDHARIGEFLGAWVHHRLDEAVTAAAYAEIFQEAFTGVDTAYFTRTPQLTGEAVAELTGSLLGPLVERFGDEAARSFHHGFEDARRLASLGDEDLAVQLDWADRLDEYKIKAEKLDALISESGIEVDLETFVESHEETSTTHVHDDHRLVVVEVGQMHFWNNVGQMIPMDEGDKLLIPAERLHGSMVRSGTCTYHQPVISDELLSQV